ncbi:hypothetical protein [Dyella caseinilytica]|uniref:Lipoprotein n=1 Tax=Dyella caseinilytica TaxID=1849581 RepID=A0ABX7GVP5_9GAMM|nr:hypothetical protein [Dyella caseinilytica]QRN54375.1 hypothetical protein ISN74_03035 [Dyella caseinilytica]GFZ93701.1 hypothetical protein GCM10011408_11860 [Dyella caseinilytica]
MMTKHPFRAFRNFSAMLALGTLLLTGASCSAKSPDGQSDAGKGPSGTLTYQGVVSGNVVFSSADCAFDGHQHLVTFNAPHQDKLHPELKTPGPFIDVAFVDPGAMVQFTTSQQNPTKQTSLMGMQQKDGISYAKKGNSWVVTITGLQLPNLDVMNQKTATLSGTFVCTHLING